MVNGDSALFHVMGEAKNVSDHVTHHYQAMEVGTVLALIRTAATVIQSRVKVSNVLLSGLFMFGVGMFIDQIPLVVRRV